jgi:hypothetical protein
MTVFEYVVSNLLLAFGAVIVTAVLVAVSRSDPPPSRRSVVGAALHGVMWVFIGAGLLIGRITASFGPIVALGFAGAGIGFASAITAGLAPFRRIGDPEAWRGSAGRQRR